MKENSTFEPLETKAFKLGKSLPKTTIPTIPTYSKLISVPTYSNLVSTINNSTSTINKKKIENIPKKKIGVNFIEKYRNKFKNLLKDYKKEAIEPITNYLYKKSSPITTKVSKILKEMQKGYQPTGDELFNELSTKKQAKAFSKEFLAESIKIPPAITEGVLFSYSSAFGLAQRFGWNKAKPIADKIEEWAKAVAPEDPDIATDFASGLGSTLSMYIPSFGIVKGASLISGLSPKIANIVGNTAATFIESAMESGGVYRNLKKQGVSDEVAKKNTDIDFGINIILLSLTDRFHFIKNEQISLVKEIKNRLLTGGRELIQELAQQVTGNILTYKNWDDGIKEAAGIGGILGFMFGGSVNPNININLPTQKEIIDLLNQARKSEAGFAKIPFVKDTEDIDRLKEKEKELKEAIKNKRGMAINEKIELAQVKKKIEETNKIKKEVPEIPKLKEVIEEVKPISKKLESIQKAKAEGKSFEDWWKEQIAYSSDDIQQLIDNKIDKQMAKGLSFKEANNTKSVRDLFEKKFAIDDKNVRELKSMLFSKMGKGKIQKDVVERQLGLKDEGTLLKISLDNMKNFLEDPKTKQNLVDDILTERHLSKNIFNPRVSGLTEKGRLKLVKELGDEVNKIYDAVDSIRNFVPTSERKLLLSNIKTKSQSKELWDKANKVKPTLPKSKPVEIPKELESIQKAKAEGKSFEEFVKSKPIFYHTTSEKIAPIIEREGFAAKVGERSLGVTKGKGTFLYKEDLEATKEFGKNFKSPKIIEATVDGKIFNATADKYPSIRSLAEDVKLINKLKSEGFVGIRGDEIGQDVYFIFKPGAIKTKAQLKELWNKTNKPKPVETKIPKELEKKAKPLENDIISHIKKNGGITVDFNGNIIKDGYAFSILDKTDEVTLTIDKKFDTMFIEIFNNFKNKYKNKKDVYFGGWVEGNKFIFDIVYQSKSLKKSLYEGILKRQTAIGDLAKYNTGKDGTINISKEIIDSIEPLSRGSFKESKTIFKNWNEVKSYYSKKNYINTPEINSEVISKIKSAKSNADFVVSEKIKKAVKNKKAIDALKIVKDIEEKRAKEKVIKKITFSTLLKKTGVRPQKGRSPSLIKVGEKPQSIKITKAEDILLKSQIRAQARTARKVVAKTRKETREKILKDIKEKKETVKNIKKAIYDYAKELPVSLRGKLLGKMKNVNTHKKLEEEVAPLVAKLKEGYSRKVVIKEINKIYEKVKYKKQTGRRVDRRYNPDIQKVLNKFREVSELSKSEAQGLINKNLEEYKDKIMPANKAMDNRILSMASGMKNMSLTELIALKNIISRMEETGAISGALIKFNREAKEKAEKEKAVEMITENGLAKGIETIGARYKYEASDGFFNLIPQLKTKEGRNYIKKASSNKLITLFKSMVGWKDIMDILSSKDKSSLPWNSWLSRHFNITPSESNYKEGLAIQNEKLKKMYRESYKIETDRELIKKIREDTEKFSLGIFETKIDGEKISIDLVFSKAEARYIWMVQQDPSLKEAFTKGMHYTKEMFKAIDNSLSKADKDFCKNQLKWYKEYYKKINEVYKELNGVDLPFNEFYIRIRRGDMAKDVQSSFDDDLALRRSINSGSFKVRVPNAQLIKTMSDITVMQTHIAEMEHYKSFGLKNRDINTVFGDSKVRAAIIQEYGKGLLSLIDDFRNTIANTGKENAYLLDGWEKMRSRFVTGVLAVRPTIALKQLISLVAYADSIPTVEFAKGEFDFWKNPDGKYKFLQKHSKFFKYRGENIERDLRTASQSDAYAAFRNKSSWINALMLNVRLGDKAAILIGGWSVYKYHYDQAIKAGKSESEAIKQGITKFEDISSSTQQSAASADQSVMQRGNPLMKMFTVFLSSPNLYFRKVIGAFRNLKAGRGSKIQHAKTIAIYWFLIPILFQLISDFGRWDEKEQKRAMILGPMNGIFIVGDGLNYILREVMGMKRFNQNEIYQTIFSDIVKAMKSTVDMVDDTTTENVMQAIKDLSNISGKATGLPLKYGYDITRGIADTMSGKYVKGIGEMAGWSEYVIKQKIKDVKKKKREKKRKAGIKELNLDNINLDNINLDDINLDDLDNINLDNINLDDINLDSIDLSDIDISSL